MLVREELGYQESSNKIHLKAKHWRTECRLWDEKEEKRKTKTAERKKQANLISAGITEAIYHKQEN